jgi:hypothetical protein
METSAIPHDDQDPAFENKDTQTKSKEEKRREYFRNYYHSHVDLIAERKRKQEFYAKHKDEILEKAKRRYQKKKL